MTHIHGPSCDDDAELGNMASVTRLPTREQVVDLQGAGDMEALLRKYEAEAQRMYDNRTAGDHSWLGLLSSFAFELAAARSES